MTDMVVGLVLGAVLVAVGAAFLAVGDAGLIGVVLLFVGGVTGQVAIIALGVAWGIREASR